MWAPFRDLYINFHGLNCIANIDHIAHFRLNKWNLTHYTCINLFIKPTIYYKQIGKSIEKFEDIKAVIRNRKSKQDRQWMKCFISTILWLTDVYKYIYNTCALSKHIGNMCMRLRNGGKGEASPSLFPRFAPNTHIYLYASTVHMYCIYPAILNRK
jgi:hypothetical protein